MPDLLDHLVFDSFHTVAANYTCNFGDIGIHLWRPDKKIFEITLFIDLLLQGLFIESCQPKNNGVYLFLCATLAFAFYIQGMYTCEKEGTYSFFFPLVVIIRQT
jgi:hypothetical protein